MLGGIAQVGLALALLLACVVGAVGAFIGAAFVVQLLIRSVIDALSERRRGPTDRSDVADL